MAGSAAAPELQILAERLTSQRLAGPPAASAETVAEHLLAIQAQDPRGARLAVRARTTGLTAADVDRGLNDRSLLITWLCRGTLHLIRAEDYLWLQTLTTLPLHVANARRLAQEGVSASAAERGVKAIERSLGEEGPLTRAQLRGRVSAARVPVQGQALVHLLLLASLRGLIVRGPMLESDHAFVLVRDWLGEPAPAIPRERALAELARRYLVGHGPAEDRDLAKWAGLPLRDARAGLGAIASELAERPDGLADLRIRPPAADLPPPRLLGPFDPLLLGWRSRETILQQHKGIVTVNGIFRPFALVRGRAAAIWGISGGSFAIAPFGRLAAADSAALEADARDVKRFLGVGGHGP
jgi:hypothetical protein